MFFVFGGALLWWGALGDLMVWGVLAGGGSYVLEGCSSVLGPAVFQFAPGGLWEIYIKRKMKVIAYRSPCEIAIIWNNGSNVQVSRGPHLLSC